MAIITYTQDAVLGAYQQWLMQQGAQACLEKITKPQAPAGCDVAGAIVAQAGSQIRYSVLTTQASVNVFFSGQFQTEAGAWQNVAETVVGTSAGGVDQVTRPAVAGCYRTFVASVGSAVVAGSEVYVLAELGRTNNGEFQPYAILVSGYVRTNEPIDSGPNPGTKNPPAGGGSSTSSCVCPSTFEIRSIDGIQAAQGWQDNYTPAANTAERVVSIVGYGTNGATVANRNIFAEFIAVGAGPVMWIQSTDTLTAGQSYSIQGMVERGADFTRLTDFYKALPATLWWSTEYQVQIGIGNFQAGDTIDDGYVITEIRS